MVRRLLISGMHVHVGIPDEEDRIDILNQAAGIRFEDAIEAGDSFELQGRTIPVIGREALLRNKRAAGRAQDIADVAALEAIASQQE